ncbi:hypothetical protein JCM8097_004519 [Rhodosporidiobolus ruineniae]
MASPSVPSALKPIAPYLARAHELSTAEPVISYWCTYFALQQAMSIGAGDGESQAFLLGLMDKLEAAKAANEGNEAFTDDAAAAAYVENFGLRLFSQADNEDRQGKASRLTARKFLAAANFLELLSIFGDVGAENRDKIKYGKWKATDIAKAFREGRAPTPGPAGGLSAEEKQAPETSAVTADEAKELSRELAALQTAVREEEGEGETAAEEQVEADKEAEKQEGEGGEAEEPEGYPFPQHPTSFPSAPAPPPSAPDFAGVDSDEDPEPTPPSLSRAATPSVPSFLSTPADSASSSTAPTPPPHIPETHQTSELHPPTTHLASEPPAFPSAVFPSAPSLPPAPPAPLPSSSSSRPAIPPPPAPVAQVQQDNFDVMTVGKVQKHCKWAISALDYEDWETARRELRVALAMLGG